MADDLEYEIPEEDAIAMFIEYLIDEGALILDGINEQGEPVYLHDMDKLELLAPEYAAEHLRRVEDAAIMGYQEDKLSLDFRDDWQVEFGANNPPGGEQ